MRRLGASWPVSRVLSGGCPPRRPFIWDWDRSQPPATNPGGGLDRAWSQELPPRPCRPYSVLLPVGFAVPPPLPETRCALTAPFHPYRLRLPCAGGLLSVALSLGSPPAAVSRHRRSLEPGLSSTGRVWPRSLFARQRPSGQLASAIRGRERGRSRGVRRGQPVRINRAGKDGWQAWQHLSLIISF